VIPKTQTRVGEQGNCFATVLSSILETPLPEFGKDVPENVFWKNADAWLAKQGLRYEQVPVGGIPPVGWSTIEGTSPRGGQHACVAYNGKLVYDPHPVEDDPRRGLVEPRVYGLLLPRKSRMEKLYERRPNLRPATDFKPPSFLTLAIAAALYLYLRDVHDRKEHAADPEPYVKYFGTKAL